MRCKTYVKRIKRIGSLGIRLESGWNQVGISSCHQVVISSSKAIHWAPCAFAVARTPACPVGRTAPSPPAISGDPQGIWFGFGLTMDGH